MFKNCRSWTAAAIARLRAGFRKARLNGFVVQAVIWGTIFPAGLSVSTGGAFAAQPELTVSADLPLRFGSLLIPASGSRIVTSRGQVIDSGLFDIGDDPVGPAQFTVTYDRGNEGRKVLNLRVQIFLSGGGPVKVDGVEARLSQLESDSASSTGGSDRVLNLTLANCRERRCSMSVKVGGRLDVTRSVGGAKLVVALAATGTVVDVD